MAAPIASVLSEANVVASKQLKSNGSSGASAANESFNQILAKQIDAKRNDKNQKAEKINSPAPDHSAVNKSQAKSTTSPDQVDEANSVEQSKSKDDTQDDASISPTLFTVVDNIVQSNALKPENNNESENTQATNKLASDIATNAALKNDDLTELDAAKIVDKQSDAVENKSDTDFKENLATTGLTAQSQKDALIDTDAASKSKLTALLANNDKKVASKDSDAVTDKTSVRKNADLLARSDVSNPAGDTKEALSSTVDNKLFQTKLTTEKQAIADTLKDPTASSTSADSTPSAVFNFAQSSTQVNNVLPEAVQHLAPHVGTRAWDQALGQKVIWLVAGGEQSAELTLNPPELGPLQVILNVNNDQLSADFSSHQQDVRDALESSLPKLKQILNDAGIQLSGFSVNAGTQNSNQQFQQDRSNNNFRSSQVTQRSDPISITAASSSTRTVVKEGIVDTFV
jgi:flagellar hook-length control protein FliK